MIFSYEISHPQYRRFVMIKHKGVPIECGGRLITPHSFVMWWPMNWLLALVNIWRLIKPMGK